jgi:hypothetical protein
MLLPETENATEILDPFCLVEDKRLLRPQALLSR